MLWNFPSKADRLGWFPFSDLSTEPVIRIPSLTSLPGLKKSSPGQLLGPSSLHYLRMGSETEPEAKWQWEQAAEQVRHQSLDVLLVSGGKIFAALPAPQLSWRCGVTPKRTMEAVLGKHKPQTIPQASQTGCFLGFYLYKCGEEAGRAHLCPACSWEVKGNVKILGMISVE